MTTLENSRIFYNDKADLVWLDDKRLIPARCYFCHSQYRVIGIYKFMCENGHIRELKHEYGERLQCLT